MKLNVSEGIVLPDGIVFVENNLPTGQITLKKGNKYRYGAKIKTVKIGNWMIYASPDVYVNVNGYLGVRHRRYGYRKFGKLKNPSQDIVLERT